ncbi:conserved hypothetical protein [Culex quinquefasciatus]|uniref:Uncharacterized protein n=1 Tax=Culex quinquefasciatus TaxID=7176 RepID=B0WM90_CULQU|nr:conserved hypothetical protein [Culex quinquefasciatus]|eukprot:XP_001849824.1 conserved hypothetical protein [Culex quinquefasciatus]
MPKFDVVEIIVNLIIMIWSHELGVHGAWLKTDGRKKRGDTPPYALGALVVFVGSTMLRKFGTPGPPGMGLCIRRHGLVCFKLSRWEQMGIEPRTIRLQIEHRNHKFYATHPNEDPAYLHELCSQMDQKQHRTENSRAAEFETSRQHFETWSTFWGRPGHGAPLPNKNKLNLDNLLYAAPR